MPDLIIIILAATVISVILMRLDVRIAAVLTIVFLMVLALKQLFNNEVPFSLIYGVLAIVVAYRSKEAFIGDKKGQWRKWPWY